MASVSSLIRATLTRCLLAALLIVHMALPGDARRPFGPGRSGQALAIEAGEQAEIVGSAVTAWGAPPDTARDPHHRYAEAPGASMGPVAYAFGPDPKATAAPATGHACNDAVTAAYPGLWAANIAGGRLDARAVPPGLCDDPARATPAAAVDPAGARSVAVHVPRSATVSALDRYGHQAGRSDGQPSIGALWPQVRATAQAGCGRPGPAASFRASLAPAGGGPPEAAIVSGRGQPLALTVTALDAAGCVATGYAGTAHFTSSDAETVLPGGTQASYTFTAADQGTHTFTPLSLWVDGPATVTVADGSIQGTAQAKVQDPMVGTNATGDGLPDDWKRYGVWVTPAGKSPVYVNLPAMGADPNKPDIFVQVDAMAGGGHDAHLADDSIRPVVQAFASSPYRSPTGSVGINLHVDAGPDSIMNYRTGATWGALSAAITFPFANPFSSFDGQGNYLWGPLDALKAMPGGFYDHGRGPIFHYCAAIWYLGGGFDGMSRGIIASDFVVAQQDSDLTNPPLTDWQRGVLLMHELGHQLGLRHGGFEDTNYKPNYLSVMNYFFALNGLRSVQAVDAADPAWSYEGSGWVDRPGDGVRGGDLRRDATAGDSATLSFSGTQVELSYPLAPDQGTASLFLDGSPDAALATSGPAGTLGYWTSNQLSAGSHHLTLSVAGAGSWIPVARALVSVSAVMDYSRSALPALDEAHLSDTVAIAQGTGYATYYVCPGGDPRRGIGLRAQLDLAGPFDWDCSGSSTKVDIQSDVDGYGAIGILRGYDDWDNLKLANGTVGGAGAGTGIAGAGNGPSATPP